MKMDSYFEMMHFRDMLPKPQKAHGFKTRQRVLSICLERIKVKT
jgi:hypothetical protein